MDFFNKISNDIYKNTPISKVSKKNRRGQKKNIKPVINAKVVN